MQRVTPQSLGTAVGWEYMGWSSHAWGQGIQGLLPSPPWVAGPARVLLPTLPRHQSSACVAIREVGRPYSEAPPDFLGLMSTGSLRDMEAGEEAKAMDISPMEQEVTTPEAPAIEEPPSPPREGECADQQAQRG